MHQIRTTWLVIVTSAALAMPLFAYAQEIREIVFPMDGKYSFSDSFGDPRSGGRTHIGTDIMAKKMTPLVSAVNGYISYMPQTQPSWGYTINIKDSEKYTYKYLHLNNDTPGTDDNQGGTIYAYAPTISRGSKVVAGQLIGWVGDSGNAENAGSHLHFEIWTPEGKPINSYPSLVAATQPEAPKTIYNFTRDLELGDKGEDVRQLQIYLNQAGYTVSATGLGSLGNESTYFGSATQAALIEFQQDYGISPAQGYFGSITRQFITRVSTTKQEASLGIQAGWLVKNKVYAEVFYVDENLILHWIINEQAAQKHFGPNWNQQVKEFDNLSSAGLKFGENLE